jgi:hypothetical protein
MVTRPQGARIVAGVRTRTSGSSRHDRVRAALASSLARRVLAEVRMVGAYPTTRSGRASDECAGLGCPAHASGGTGVRVDIAMGVR